MTDQDEKVYQMWQCRQSRAGRHFRCYGISHTKLHEVQTQVDAMCGPDCHCWRHTVIALADKMEPLQITATEVLPLDVACPTCKSAAGEQCKSKNWKRTDTHQARKERAARLEGKPDER